MQLPSKISNASVGPALGCEAGGVTIIFAFVVVGLIGFVGLAVDYGMWVNRRIEMQANADRAVLAGARELLEGSAERAAETANRYLDEHGGAAGPVDISVDPALGKVSMRLESTGDRFFSVFHLGRDPPISVIAEAVTQRKSGRLCALALDRTGNPGIHMNGDGILTAPDCIVWTNSQTGNAIKAEKSVSASTKRLCAVGGASNSSKGTVTPSPEKGCEEQPDPLEGFSLVVPPGCNFTKFSSNDPVVHLTPGTYCDGITISSDRVIAAPGTYFIKDGIMAISGTSDVVFEESTIYMSGDKVGITIKGDSVLRITAPTSGFSAEIAIAMDPLATAAKESSFAGSSRIYISGALHLPQEKIKISGDSVGIAELENALIIGSQIEFGGGARWTWKAVEKLPLVDDRPDVVLWK